jgi:hypothetical protein
MVRLKWGPLEIELTGEHAASQPDTLLEYVTVGLSFVADFTAAIIWPAAIFAVVWIFRRPVEGLLARLKGLIAPGVELAFDRMQERAEEARESLPPAAGEVRPIDPAAHLPSQSDSSAPSGQIVAQTAEGTSSVVDEDNLSRDRSGSGVHPPLAEGEEETPGISHGAVGTMIVAPNVNPFDHELARAHSAVFRAVRRLDLLPPEKARTVGVRGLVSMLDKQINGQGFLTDFYNSIVLARRSARREGDGATVRQLADFETAVRTFRDFVTALTEAEANRREFKASRFPGPSKTIAPDARHPPPEADAGSAPPSAA